MKQNEILQAAKEAGFAPNRSYTNIPVTGYATHDLSDQIKAFAAIIEKRTIERCEAACNSLIKKQRRHQAAYGIGYLVYDAEDCAAAIRKLGEQE